MFPPPLEVLIKKFHHIRPVSASSNFLLNSSNEKCGDEEILTITAHASDEGVGSKTYKH
jgi:hypothetical protein